ncbi:LAETG motif-containing sortase-dependent surface protein [Embleya sp. AB8]|uniref:LAETG motif-containing sortase-dependent surface protein n=1 Tax=Embleya sp. AB8 TaxID=3156304 RepID=UPI003C7803C9
MVGAGLVLAASVVLLAQPAFADGTPPVTRPPGSAPTQAPDSAPTRPPGSAPTTPPGSGSVPTRPPGSVPTTPPETPRLAQTGGNDHTALYVGAGAALLLVGGGTVGFARRRRGTTA